eukprot:scaffold18258_cov18-Tisochrysis_lutea.AAC.1
MYIKMHLFSARDERSALHCDPAAACGRMSTIGMISRTIFFVRFCDKLDVMKMPSPSTEEKEIKKGKSLRTV